MTQSQWLHFTGTNPSRYHTSWTWRGDPEADEPIHVNTPWNPIEQVSWFESQQVLGQLGLVLPTEAQWECAARAGTDTSWWCGDDKTSIGSRDAGNLADAWSRSKGGPPAWQYEEWEDHWMVHAPVGTFQPNPFGLHDTIGNVWEWCRDSFGGYDIEVSPSDGLRVVTDADDYATRGGSFFSTASNSRAAYRFGNTPEIRSYNLGVRPARAIETGPP